MEKDITFYPKKIESEKRYCSDVSQIVYSNADYSSCVDITVPDFRQYLKIATTFWNDVFTG